MIIVSEGGVGRPIDEIVLNQALFERHGVRILGAVVNKVNLDASPHLADVLRRGPGASGHRAARLHSRTARSWPTRRWSCSRRTWRASGWPGTRRSEHPIGRVAIGAMQAEHAVPFLRDRTLLITPGDRDDLLDAALEADASAASEHHRLCGVILTGGFMPRPPILDRLRAAQPVDLPGGDRYLHGPPRPCTTSWSRPTRRPREDRHHHPAGRRRAGRRRAPGPAVAPGALPCRP